MCHRDYWRDNEANNIAVLDSLEDDFLDRIIQEDTDICHRHKQNKNPNRT